MAIIRVLKDASSMAVSRVFEFASSMASSRVFKIASTMAAAQSPTSLFLSPPRHHLRFHILYSLAPFFDKVSSLHPRLGNIVDLLHHRMSTSVENKGGNENDDDTNQSNTTSKAQSTSQSGKRRKSAPKRTKFSDSESDSEGEIDDMSREDLIKLVLKKEQVLKQKQNEYSQLKDKFMRNYAEKENVMDRTRRDAESSKKFAVQNFAKSLLDVADNLGRASSLTKESFEKIDVSNDAIGAVPLLKSLLEGVEMTDKQLAEAFRKSGIEKYDPTNEQFDPNRHNAVFQVPDNDKSPGTVAVVLKAGYTLHDRIIRAAEVGVTVAIEKNETS